MSFLSKLTQLGGSRKNKDTANGNGNAKQPLPQSTAQEQPLTTASPASSKKKFGRALREDFDFDPAYLNLNHGSFGATPRPVRDALRRYQDQAEAKPDHFIRYDQPKLVDKSRAALAKLLHAPEDTIVMIQNATTGVHTVLSNLQYEEGDVIVYFDSIYGACEKIIAFLTETTPVEMAKVKVTYPISDAALLAEFRRVIDEQRALGRKVKVALFDTVSSMPGVRMPFEELSKTCRELDILSMVDGAHGVGHLQLDLEKLDFDFFVSNCHKYAAPPCLAGTSKLTEADGYSRHVRPQCSMCQ